MEVRGHHRQRADLRCAGDRERLAEDAWKPSHAALDAWSQQHYRSRARKRELETDVPGELRPPGQHPRTRDREGVPDVRRPPERGACDREAAHHRRADRGWRRAAHQGVHADEREGRPHRVLLQQRAQRSLHDAREHSDLETAEH